jgi:hypothetical protein
MSNLRLKLTLIAYRFDCNRFAKVFMLFNTLYAAMTNLSEISQIMSLRVQ